MWVHPTIPRVAVKKEFLLPSRTKQAFKEESDINAIMRRYLSGQGELMLQRRVEPRYGDFSSAGDYLSAMVQVRRAQELFLELPSSVRDAVDNDPAKLLDLVFDPARREEAAELGLLSEAAVSAMEAAAEAAAATAAGATEPTSTTAPVKGGSEGVKPS